MAPPSEVASESESDLNDKKDETKVFLKCHKSTKCSVVVCVNCFQPQHRSCASKNAEIIDSMRIRCCQTADNMGENKNQNTNNLCIPQTMGPCVNTNETNEMSLKIFYLERIVREVSEKNDILKENNRLLLQRINILENISTPVLQRDPKQDNNIPRISTYNLNEISSDLQYADVAGFGVKTQKTGGTEEKLSHAGVSGPGCTIGNAGKDQRFQAKDNSRNTANQFGDSLKSRNVHLKIPHLHSANELTTFEMEKSATSELSGDSPFVFPAHRRSRGGKRLGNAQPEADSNFTGGDRRAWLYIYRVNRNCTEDMITDYIKRKEGFQDCSIKAKEIPSESNFLKRFLVIAPLSKKDEMYNPNFWPKFVGVTRFKFDMHKEFLKASGEFFVLP